MSFSVISNRKQVGTSRLEAEKDKVVVPMTIEEYCIKHTKQPVPDDNDFTDFYDDDYGDDYEDDDDEDLEDDDEEENELDAEQEEEGQQSTEVDPKDKPSSSSQSCDSQKTGRQEVDSGNEES